MSKEVVLELFAGPGGWSTGLRAAGYKGRALGLEWDTAACETARAAGHERIQVDISDVDPTAVFADKTVDQVVGLIASPPCQGFSSAGHGKGRVDSVLLLKALETVQTAADLESVIERMHHLMTDDRSLLALEPLLWTLTLRPDWIAWEQVPAVQALWDACAVILRRNGYSVDTRVLSAEQYDVPQTRKRAILVGSRTREVTLPAPVRSRYHARSPEKLDPGLPRWVSMAEALGWGMTARPYPTVAAGTEAGGQDPQMLGGSGARQAVHREWETGRWITRESDVEYVGGKQKNATRRDLGHPAPTVLFGHSGIDVRWSYAGMNAAGAKTVTGPNARPMDAPAGTITGQSTAAWVPTLDKYVKPHLAPAGTSSTAVDPRPITSPSATITGMGTAEWGERTTRAPGPDQRDPKGRRVSVQEASVLQSFPHDYPWQGSKTAQYRQVGDAVPPLLAYHVLRAVMPEEMFA